MSPRIYTKKGDQGKTSLIGGRRVSKASPRLETYGTIDELNAILGKVRGECEGKAELGSINDDIRTIQNYLFSLGSHLAVAEEKHRAMLPELEQKQITLLENRIDEMQKTLPELKQFILPGGTSLSAWLHIARAVCRRAERLAVQLAESEQIASDILVYLNRLSDYLFVAARFTNQAENTNDLIWQKPSL